MLRHLSLRDVVIVPSLALPLGPGFTVLTGETGAGKSILIDALQLALGARADAGVVREGAGRAEVAAEFDAASPALRAWLAEAGFAEVGDTAQRDHGHPPGADDDSLLLRRTVDAQGRSRAWINGSPATLAQLRSAAEHLVDIHGQHAWQTLTQPATARAALDAHAGIELQALRAAHAAWAQARQALDAAIERREALEQQRERLLWQLGDIEKLGPQPGEWQEIEAEHRRLAHGQALIEAAQHALDLLTESEEANAAGLAARAADALEAVRAHDGRLEPVLDALAGALVQLRDAGHALSGYLGAAELDPQRLAALDARLGAWVALARRHRQPAEALPALWQAWREELAGLDAAADLPTLEAAEAQARQRYDAEAATVSRHRRAAAPHLGAAVTEVMQGLGMAGGRLELALALNPEPSPHGAETVEFLVAGHAGSTPRPLAKVASGGELSRLALAIAVTALQRGDGAPTLIFDEIDAGIGGEVGDVVGQLMRRLGQRVQVLAVTHLAQVAAAADDHWTVSKSPHTEHGHTRTTSQVQPVQDDARVAEIARMLGGPGAADGTRIAHARAMLDHARQAPAPELAAPSGLPAQASPTPSSARSRRRTA